MSDAFFERDEAVVKDHEGFRQPDRAEEWAHRERMRREAAPPVGWSLLALLGIAAVLMLIALGLSVIFAD